jgi:hypothetical protein
LATCQGIAATGADRTVVTALQNETGGVLERTAVDADLEYAAVPAGFQRVVVAEH